MGTFLNAVGGFFIVLSLLATVCAFIAQPWLLVLLVPLGWVMFWRRKG